MPRAEIRHSTPDEALHIANHANMILGDMRRETSKDKLNATYGHWVRYAKDHGVCHQIKEHLHQAYRECSVRCSPRSQIIAGAK